MSPIIYAYVLLFTALVGLAAAAIEWGVQGRIPARYLWSAAMWVALLAPPAAVAWHVGSNSDGSESGAVSSRVLAITVNAARTTARRATVFASSDAPIHSLITHRPNWRAEAARVSGKLSPALLVLWIGGSVAFMIWLVAGALHWRRARRTWHAAVMDGVEVDVSPATGPAVLGIISHRIVMPEWAMSMASEQQRLMLAHEREHVSARDPQRLALAVVALILMPWNAVLWWCTARLRRAIEMDCDARVLQRYPCAKEYGRLLLDVAARGHGFESVGIPAVALLRLPSELETRLCAISRGRYVGKRTLAVGGMIAVVAIVTAFATPVPRMQLVSGVRQTGVEIPRLTRRMTRLIVIPYRKPVLVIDPVSTDTGARWRTDSLRSLAQRNDSLALIARQLARKARELSAVRAALDSTNRALTDTRARLSAASAQLDVSNERVSLDAERSRFMRDQSNFMRDQAIFMREQAEDNVIRQKQLPLAIARYYPDISVHAKPGMLLWFVADSSGRVIRTARDENYNRSIYFSAERVAQRFTGIDPHGMSIWVGPATIGNTDVTVVWARAGKQ